MDAEPGGGDLRGVTRDSSMDLASHHWSIWTDLKSGRRRSGAEISARSVEAAGRFRAHGPQTFLIWQVMSTSRNQGSLPPFLGATLSWPADKDKIAALLAAILALEPKKTYSMDAYELDSDNGVVLRACTPIQRSARKP